MSPRDARIGRLARAMIRDMHARRFGPGIRDAIASGEMDAIAARVWELEAAAARRAGQGTAATAPPPAVAGARPRAARASKTCTNPGCDHRDNPQCGDGLRRGYCSCCHARWRYHGYPAAGPPAPSRTRLARPGTAAPRLEDYGWLRTEIGLDLRAAARRVGVGERTARRYERHLRAVQPAGRNLREAA